MRTMEMAGRPELATLEWPIEPTHPNYRELPLEQGFGWRKLLGEVIEYLGRQQDPYYGVDFFSERRPGDEIAARIAELDEAAYEEAKSRRPDALLHYFGGTPDDQGRARSWCLWTDHESARDALSGPAHAAAVRAARGLDDPEGQGLYVQYEVNAHNIYLLEDGRTVVFETAEH